MTDRLETISMTYHATSVKAVLLSNDGLKKNGVWLPLSQIEMDPFDPSPNNIVEVTGPEWLFKKNGLI
jgi:hypothetical protein